MVLRQNRHSIYKYNYFCYSIKKKNVVVRDTTEKIIYVLTLNNINRKQIWLELSGK